MDDLHPTSKPPSGFHGAGLEDSFAPIDKNSLSETGFNDGIGRHGRRFRKADRKCEIHIHVWPQDQVGILGLHAIKDRPVAIDKQVVVRPMMYTALTYDHRIVDGSEAVQFLVRVKQLVEDPGALLLE